MIVLKPTKVASALDANVENVVDKKVKGGFLHVAMEFALRHAFTVMAVGALAGYAVVQLNQADAGELRGFYSNHLEVGRSASRSSNGCGQYVSPRLASRIDDPSVSESTAAATNHTAWDGTTMNYGETTFTMLDGQVTATVGCDRVPSAAVNSTATSTNTFPGLRVTFSNVDDSVCSNFIAENANSAWVVRVGSASTQRIIKAYNEDTATGLYLDGTSVCNLGDGANTIVVYDRTSG